MTDIEKLREAMEKVREARGAMDTRDGRSFITRYNALAYAEEELIDTVIDLLPAILEGYERMEKACKEARAKLNMLRFHTTEDAENIIDAANILDAALLTPKEDRDER